MTNTPLAKDRLRSFVERIERVEEEKAGLADDIREIYAEAKGAGFDTKIIRQVIKERKMSAEDRAEQAALLDVYRHALGMLADMPLGKAALARLTEEARS
jgi:uncharacterized protein (UPF0335 family)